MVETLPIGQRFSELSRADDITHAVRDALRRGVPDGTAAVAARQRHMIRQRLAKPRVTAKAVWWFDSTCLR